MATTPRWQAQGVGALGVVEVRYITPVVRGRGLAAALLQEALDEGVFAEAPRTHQIEVIAPVGDVYPQSDGLERPFLAKAGA